MTPDEASDLYDSNNLGIFYEAIVLNEGWVKDYDDVDAIAEKAFDMFWEEVSDITVAEWENR